MTIYEKLLSIQCELKAPKSKYNSFGKYHYRSLEDILEAIKPLCKKYKTVLIIHDDVELIGTRFYVKATARLQDLESDQYVENTAYAREEETKKGMDASQITGSVSTYSRKYAMNGLFAIDDTKDADSMDNSTCGTKTVRKMTPAMIADIRGKIKRGGWDESDIARIWNVKSLDDLQYDWYDQCQAHLSQWLSNLGR